MRVKKSDDDFIHLRDIYVENTAHMPTTLSGCGGTSKKQQITEHLNKSFNFDLSSPGRHLIHQNSQLRRILRII